MVGHEFVLEENHVRFYLGKVVEVALNTSSKKPVDAIGRKLKEFEIIFDSGDIMSNCRAVPFDIRSEVKKGDEVIIMSFEHIYNNTFYYVPLRRDTEDGGLHIEYDKSKISFKAADVNSTELKLQSGSKAYIEMIQTDDSTLISSGLGGITLDSKSGVVTIKNSSTSLHKILGDLISEISGLKVVTDKGPVPISPTTAGKLSKIGLELESLLGDN